MSAKNNDIKGRWRNINISFRVSPEEDYKIDMYVETSGLSKREYICQKLLNTDITVYPNIRVEKYFDKYLIELTSELKRLEKIEQDSDVLENITYLVELISKMTPI